MRLGQLYSYLGDMLREGADENLPVCVPCAGGHPPAEVDRIMHANGRYQEDAGPGYAWFLQRDGHVMVLMSGTAQREHLTRTHTLTPTLPPTPEPDRHRPATGAKSSAAT